MNGFILAVLLLAVADASAATRSGRTAKARRAEAGVYYQAGIDHYAAGRFPQALGAFQEALRRDPGSRAARLAASRVREEMAMTAAQSPAAARPAGDRRPRPSEREDLGLFSRVARVFAFERTVGDERESSGRAQAMQGRIAQLLAERKVARARRRAFGKDAELHALSRRLS